MTHNKKFKAGEEFTQMQAFYSSTMAPSCSHFKSVAGGVQSLAGKRSYTKWIFSFPLPISTNYMLI
jgi:hypothetical protein